MKLYDEVISNWNNLIKDSCIKSLPVTKDTDWPDIGNHQMILRSDMAYELGGSVPSVYALGSTSITADTTLVSKDEIILIGPDINEISNDVSYARLTIALINDSTIGDGNTLYNAIKKIDNVRYHVNPEGFMTRVSSVYGRESIRVSKEAVSKGLSFEKIGNIFMQKYHENPNIKAVKLVYITDPSFDFKTLSETVKKASSITQAIDHIMKDAMTDCSACSLQKVCDEVEDLRKLHFSR